MGRIASIKDWFTTHIGLKSFILIFVTLFFLTAFFRFWAAPLSAGPDVIQFWAFVQTFEDAGLDFYAYAEATDGSFPFWGWAYVYPPIWVLILYGCSLFSPNSLASTSAVDESWRLAMKTPIIVADLAIGAIIFWAVPGSKWKKLLFACLWLFHPTGWYESAVFGQFDAIAAAFLLASVVLLTRNSYKLGFFFAGMAVMTKQHTFIPIALMMIIVLQQIGLLNFLKKSLVMAGVIIAFSIPFLVTGNFNNYIESVFLPGWSPDCQRPLCYAFSGSASLFTYLHDNHGWNTCGWLKYNTYVLAIAMLITAGLTYRRKLSVAQAALIGMIVFIALNYQINYQYLVIYIPLAILVAAQTNNNWQRYITLGIAIMPAIWLWFFDVSYWFRAYEPVHYSISSIFENIGWTAYQSSDKPYVAFAVSLMLVCITYVVITFLRWYEHQTIPHDSIDNSKHTDMLK